MGRRGPPSARRMVTSVMCGPPEEPDARPASSHDTSTIAIAWSRATSSVARLPAMPATSRTTSRPHRFRHHRRRRRHHHWSPSLTRSTSRFFVFVWSCGRDRKLFPLCLTGSSAIFFLHAAWHRREKVCSDNCVCVCVCGVGQFELSALPRGFAVILLFFWLSLTRGR